MRIVTSEEMRKLDERGVQEIGISSLVLMENAGIESARLISQICQQKKYEGEILVFSGKGKNGGDGLVVARRLFSWGHKVRVFLMHDPSEYTHEAGNNLKILEKHKTKVSVVDHAAVLEDYFKSASPPFLAVDALLGTGLKRDIEGLYYDVIELLNHYVTEIIALDIPSGTNGDTGTISGTSTQASVTISFGYPKLGHFLTPGAVKRGRLFHVNLSFPREWEKQGDKFLLTHSNIAPLLQNRDRFGHKNSFGHCLLIGGSPGRLGAIDMASKSSLKMGTGLVTVASWENSFPSLEIKLSSEIMNFRVVKEGNAFVVPKPGLQIFSSIVIGPGLGMRPDGAELLRELLATYTGPLVVDADGLNLIAEHKLYDAVSKRQSPTVLTPHPGEMARFLHVTKEAVVKDPVWAVRDAAEKTNAIVVLKGPTTLIHSADGTTWFNHYPNDGMATAGSGDVLAGIIGGLLGQKMGALEATKLGVYLHSLAGHFAAEHCGHRAMTALDIIENTRCAFKDLREYQKTAIQPSCVELF